MDYLTVEAGPEDAPVVVCDLSCRDNARGNGPLLAAAPALLAALEALLAQHERPHGFDDSAWYAAEVCGARAAIARARQPGSPTVS